MAKTHTLSVVAAGGDVLRKVDGATRILVKTGRTLESFKVDELDSLTIEPVLERMLVIGRDGRGRYQPLWPGSRVDVGEDRWPVAELASFRLELIAKPVEAPAPLPSRVWEVTYLDPERAPDIVELAGGKVDGVIYDLGPEHGLDWSSGRTWGSYLDGVATMRRVEPEELQKPATNGATTTTKARA